MSIRLVREEDDFAETHEINVTPFIDVILVLLIIFMIAAPLATVDVPVDLPASTVERQQRPDKPVYLTLKSDRQIAVGDDIVARDALAAALNTATNGDRDQRIFLRADRAVSYGDVMELMNALRAAGYLKVALVGLEFARREMTAGAIALLDHDSGPHFARWSTAAAIVVAAHVGLITSYWLLRPPEPPGAPAAPVVIVELAPLPVAPASPLDIAPGPQMQEAQPPPEPVAKTPPPTPQVVELPPLPPMVTAPVVAEPLPPPEVKPEPKPVEAKPVEAKPEVKVEPKPELKPPQLKRVEHKKPAPRTTAAPRSERQTAARPAAPNPGAVASRVALADWRSQVVSKLQRAKRYPRGAEQRREQGVVTLAFTLSRNGGVLSRHIVRSSGSSELDQEALAMVQRATPFPPFPAGMTQASVQLSVPVRFSLR